MTAIRQRPVIGLGEIHTDFFHKQMEGEVISALQGDYDTLALEWPVDIEPILQKYLTSPRTPEDYRAFFTADTDTRYAQKYFADGQLRPGVLPDEKDIKELLEFRANSIERSISSNEEEPRKYRTEIANAALAHDLHYRVRCIDMPAQWMFDYVCSENKSKARDFLWMEARNRQMACEIAKDVRAGHGVISINGLAHWSHLSGLYPNTLKTELDALHIPSKIFALASPILTPLALDIEHHAFASKDVIEIVRQDLARRAALQEWREHPFRRALETGVRLLHLSKEEAKELK